VVVKQYSETGGLRWGQSFPFGANVSWPFAKLSATPSEIRIELNVFGILRRSFAFMPAELRCLRRKNGLLPFSTGIVFEHTNPTYPAFILFWTFNYQSLKQTLTRLGYQVWET
jgi:hypothetical protein